MVWIHITQRQQTLGTNFYLRIMSLCIENSVVKMGLMCANDWSTTFMTGWILCPLTFNKKLAMQSFIIPHEVNVVRGFKSASRQKK